MSGSLIWTFLRIIAVEYFAQLLSHLRNNADRFSLQVRYSELNFPE
jgi:hypothetical protein